jgi:hypothetical protein
MEYIEGSATIQTLNDRIKEKIQYEFNDLKFILIRNLTIVDELKYDDNLDTI